MLSLLKLSIIIMKFSLIQQFKVKKNFIFQFILYILTIIFLIIISLYFKIIYDLDI